MSHKTAMFVGACALLSACHNGDNQHPDGQPQADAASDDRRAGPAATMRRIDTPPVATPCRASRG